MQATIHLDATALTELDITIELFQQAASSALSTLTHPETGDAIYLNSVRVTVVADCPEIEPPTNGSDPIGEPHVFSSGYSAKAGQPFVHFEFPNVVMTEQQMLDRIKILADEMDANDEENRDMQSEINTLYAKIDAAK